MLIVCPGCTTSYMVEPASLGPAGRTVRCARCRETWFASPPEPDEPVSAFVDGVIAEAEMAERQPVRAWERDPPEDRDPRDDWVEEPAAPVEIAVSPPLVPPLVEHSPADEDGFGVEERPAFGDVPPAEDRTGRVDHMPIPEAAPEPPPASEDVETFAARHRRLQSKRDQARRSSRWTALVLVLLAFNVALVGARSEVVRFFPQTASLFAAIGLPVNLRQLSFEDVRVGRDAQGGTTMLSIEGKIVSKARQTIEVPRLRFAARNAQGREIYTWTARPDRKTLNPGENLSFRSFAKPPDDAVDIMVRFFNAQDATGGM